MISIPIWWFILSILLSLIGVAWIVWLIVVAIRYAKEYNDHL